MRALWVEDHQLVVDSLEVLLGVVMPSLSLDKARDVQTARQLVQQFQYELILLDWWIDGDSGESAIEMLRAARPSAPIIVVSGDEREPVVRRALDLGVIGFVAKSSAPAILVEAIRNALEGRAQSAAPRRNVNAVGSDASLPPIEVELAYPDLTPRQADVFRAMMLGLSDKQIARNLSVSETTIKTHVRAILQIAGVHKRGEATHQARFRGVR